METPVALNIAPLNAPHMDIEWLPLADRDFQIRDMMGLTTHLKAVGQFKHNHRNNTDVLGIWKSSMPRYYLPEVNVLPDFIHLCHAHYEPTLRAILRPDGSVLFYITPQAINEILNFKPPQTLVPLTMKLFLDQGARLSKAEISRVSQLFMKPECQYDHSPPYHQVLFNETGKLMVDMISYAK